MKSKLLTFSPYCGIWQHSFPEVVILEHLQKEYNITYIGCNGILSEFCITMMAKGINAYTNEQNKNNVCQACINKRKILESSLSYQFVLIEDLLSKKNMYDVDKIINDVKSDTFEDITINGISIGKISAYNVILKYKKNNIVFNEEREWIEYKADLKNTLLIYFALDNLFSNNMYDISMVYNSLYPTNNLFTQYCKQKNILSYTIHAGSNWDNRLSRMIVAKDSLFNVTDNIKFSWDKFKEFPLSKESVISITNHFLTIINSSNVFNYSAKYNDTFDFYSFFPRAKGKKIFLATLSSSDERFAYNYVGQRDFVQNTKLFSSQIEWLKFLVQYFKDKDDYYLIIRVHPRELPSERYDVTSDNVHKLSELLKILPPNIIVNWPSDKLSIYNLAQEVDVLLNSHSSTSLDFLFLGLPVVVYDASILTFPIDLHYFGDTFESYITAIENALDNYWDIQRIYNLYKFMNLYLNISSYDISESTKYLERSISIKEKEKIQRNSNFLFERDIANIKINFFNQHKLIEQFKGNLNSKLDTLTDIDTDNSTLDSLGFIQKEMSRVYVEISRGISVDTKLMKRYHETIKGKRNE
jgi:hypothetical protein